MADSNYCQFFKLYKTAPAMGTCLMDYCVENLRRVALVIMKKVANTRSGPLRKLLSDATPILQAFRPTVPVGPVFQQLGFDTTSQCQEFMSAQTK